MKIKHLELMDDFLQSVYPVYSQCKGFTTPYKVDMKPDQVLA